MGSSGQDTSTGAPAAPVVVLASALIAVAVLLMAGVVPLLPRVEPPLDVPWWVIAPLFTLSEFVVVHLRVGRSAFTVSFGHVPLVLGLTLLDPIGFLMASLLGSAATLLVHRRQRGLKLLFNVGLWTFEAALAVCLFGLLAQGAAPSSVRGMLAVCGTILITDQLTALAVSAVISLHERRLDAGSVVEALTWGLPAAIGNTSVALLIVVLLDSRPAAVPLLAVVLGLLVFAYRAYARLHDAHVRLERHHTFAQAMARTRGTQTVVTEILDRARDILEAEGAELHTRGRVYRAGAPRSKESPGVPATYWTPRLRTGAVLLARGTGDAQERAVLGRAGVREAAAAPVPGVDDELEGVLVVTDHLGEVASFTPRDLPMLETLAHQAGVALDNGRLLDRLRQEAADREHEALHDALTNLPNRRKFIRDVDELLPTVPSAGVLIMDLDRFKQVNEALGHGVGDELLTVVARRLRAALPSEVVLAHLSGDEFAAFVPRGSPESVTSCVEAIRTALNEAAVVGSVELHLEASFGSVCAPHGTSDADGLLQRADLALSRAKGQRSGHEPYVSALDRSGPERLALFADLRRAIDERSIHAHYQPLFDPRSRQIVAVETLARWQHPVRGPVTPDTFIPIAEGSGLIRPLTALMIEQSLTALGRLRDAGLARIAVNLSPRLLLDAGLPGQVESALTAAAVPADRLTLEVTENAVMADPDKALAVLGALRAVGVRLSVDDFGTGHSSLAYLKLLPVDEVKVDRSFVAAMARDSADRAIVRSTIALAHELGLTVVAEGVEDETTLGMLAEWGCDVAQGYLLSKPLPFTALAELFGVVPQTDRPAGVTASLGPR